MLDLTASLQHQVEAGRETYFADDTHWNAAGHDVAARGLAKFLDLGAKANLLPEERKLVEKAQLTIARR
jgi:hypothetical protein